uniref:Uncharacterized protein n=1 Tax=Steinernema glaseri TaxID=37863 RepID=A0A1I8A6P6_9BILA
MLIDNPSISGSGFCEPIKQNNINGLYVSSDTSMGLVLNPDSMSFGAVFVFRNFSLFEMILFSASFSLIPGRQSTCLPGILRCRIIIHFLNSLSLLKVLKDILPVVCSVLVQYWDSIVSQSEWSHAVGFKKT